MECTHATRTMVSNGASPSSNQIFVSINEHSYAAREFVLVDSNSL